MAEKLWLPSRAPPDHEFSRTEQWRARRCSCPSALLWPSCLPAWGTGRGNMAVKTSLECSFSCAGLLCVHVAEFRLSAQQGGFTWQKYTCGSSPSNSQPQVLCFLPLAQGFPGGTSVKNQIVMQELWVQSLSWEILSSGEGNGNAL